jgi:dienelactone hydrolase
MKTRWMILLTVAGLVAALALAAASPVFSGAPATDTKGSPSPKASAPKATGTAPAGNAPTYDEVMKNPDRKVGFLKKSLKLADGKERFYQVWIPLDYTADKRWPAILFLHGAGECLKDAANASTEVEKVLVQGVPKEIKKRKGQFEFIVVMPQSEGGWSGSASDAAIQALKNTGKEYTVDFDHLYLTGLSMGGYGTWTLAHKYPKEFAAIVPVAGGGDSGNATIAMIRQIPTWCWHVDGDGVVKVDSDREIVTALVKAGATELRYNEVHGGGHGGWDEAYGSDEVWLWLLKHKVSDLGKQKPVKAIITAPSWDGAPNPDNPAASPAKTATVPGKAMPKTGTK